MTRLYHLFYLTALWICVSTSIYAATINKENNDIFFLRQANDIPLETFVQNWPDLAACLDGVSQKIDIGCIEQIKTINYQAVILNLKAQNLRHQQLHDNALQLINEAIKLQPNQHLHHFQKAITLYQQLRKATSGGQKWMLSMATAKAYQQAFDLNSEPFHYRYYLSYHYLQTPESVGGNKQKALKMAEDAIGQEIPAFYPVRADIHFALGNKEQAREDYLQALKNEQYKRSSFKNALTIFKDEPKVKSRLENFIRTAEANLHP